MRNVMRGLGVILGAMAISLMAAPSALAATKYVVVLGDSITGSVPQGVASQSWTHLLASERDVVIRNISSPGITLGKTDAQGFNNPTTINMLTQLGGAFSAVDVVIVQAGTNDFGTNQNWGDTVNGLRGIMNWARTYNKKVIVMDPIWRANETTPNAVGNPLNTYRYFINYVCLTEFAERCVFLHRENTIMGTGAGWQHYDATEVATNTQLHPNAQGQRYIADWVKAGAAAAGIF